MSVSGVLLVTCRDKVCDKVIKKAKKIDGVKFAFRVKREKPEDADVIINMNANSEEKILSAKQELINQQGIGGIKIKIGKEKI